MNTLIPRFLNLDLCEPLKVIPHMHRINRLNAIQFHIQFRIRLWFHIQCLNVLLDYLFLFGNFTPIPQIYTHRATNLTKKIFEEISLFSRKTYINSGSSVNKRKDNSFGPILGQYYLDRHSISNTNILKITGLVKYCPTFYWVECGYLTGLWDCFLCHVETLGWWVQSPSGSSLVCEATMTAYHYYLGGT